MNLQKKKIKRQYNLTYKLRKKGLDVNGRTKYITIYLREFNGIINNHFVYELIKKHGFKLKQNKQLELFEND